MKIKNKKLLFTILSIVAFMIGFSIFANFYLDLLWFESLGFGSVYWTSFNTEYLIWISTLFIFLIFVYMNYRIANKAKPATNILTDLMTMISKFKAPLIFLNVVIVLIGFIMASVASSKWMTILSFSHGVSFGTNDPIFGRDLGFYIFKLPLYEDIKSWLMAMLIISLFLVILVYFYKQAVAFEFRKLIMSKQAQVHVSILLIAIFALEVFGFWLRGFNLLYSKRGSIFYGAGYTDINAQLTSYYIMMVVIGICALIVIYSIVKKKVQMLLIPIVLYFGSWILFGAIYPAVVQNFIVKPNEQTKELPFIENNIKYTRLAFGLDKIEEKFFEVNENLSLEDIKANKTTIDNVLLWDYRPLLSTINQLQVIRLYYNFSDVDIDRYLINNRYQQVMVSAREIDLNKLPTNAQTWVNKEFVFTHGYGITMSPVTVVSEEGLPKFFIKDIPPQSTSDFKIERPEIYFGELTTTPIIVKGDIEEFDYPVGDSNKYNYYSASSGVSIGSFFSRILFAWKYSDFSYLVTNYIKPESKILYHRNITERVKKIAPFLDLDKDPYIVLADGKLYWVMDAFTKTEYYPYSTPQDDGSNYIRNSVKIVTDAYSGDIKFYIFKPEDDPLIKVYQSIFPNLFRPLSEMPQNIKSHLRYPQDLFDIQSKMYQSYHMLDAQVFYNKEDLWTIANEKFSGKVQPMESYYIIMKMPEAKREEFLLMVPYTPNRRDNMIAWLSARCDGEDYGKLLVYKFPKQDLTFGPMQVAARIDQDAKISQELTLWNQQGSQVSRGNLLVIPINKSLLYVQPLYIQATEGQMPELKRVIVAFGNKIAMESNLENALMKVFGGSVSTITATTIGEKPTQTDVTQAPTLSLSDLSKSALDHYNNSEKAVKEGNWAKYGEELDLLKKELEKIVNLSKGK